MIIAEALESSPKPAASLFASLTLVGSCQVVTSRETPVREITVIGCSARRMSAWEEQVKWRRSDGVFIVPLRSGVCHLHRHVRVHTENKGLSLQRSVKKPHTWWYVPDRKSPQKDWSGDHLMLYLQHYETVRFDLAGSALVFDPRLRWDLWSCCQWRRACSSAVRRKGWSLPARCAGVECWILSRMRTAAGSRRGGPRLLRSESPR